MAEAVRVVSSGYGCGLAVTDYVPAIAGCGPVVTRAVLRFGYRLVIYGLVPAITDAVRWLLEQSGWLRMRWVTDAVGYGCGQAVQGYA